jgi:hypothetical protein
MNEQIKQLWVEAAETTQSDSWEEQTKFMERFAQLIIKECTSVVTGGSFLHDQAPAAHFARECEKAIQRHFDESK